MLMRVDDDLTSSVHKDVRQQYAYLLVLGQEGVARDDGDERATANARS